VPATEAPTAREAPRGQLGQRLVTILHPSLALRHPCCPIYPRHPYLPKGAKGQGTMLSQRVGQLTTQRPVGAREAPRVHLGQTPRYKSSAQPDARARSKRRAGTSAIANSGDWIGLRALDKERSVMLS
jgi:hypothetical protein